MNHSIGCLIPMGTPRKLLRAWMQMSRHTLLGHHRDTYGGIRRWGRGFRVGEQTAISKEIGVCARRAHSSENG